MNNIKLSDYYEFLQLTKQVWSTPGFIDGSGSCHPTVDFATGCSDIHGRHWQFPSDDVHIICLCSDTKDGTGQG